MNVKLNYINASNDSTNSQVVFFQKNVATGFDEIAVAWKVIQNCGSSCNHPFTFTREMQVNVSNDSWGNSTPKLVAEVGQLYRVNLAASGNQLSHKGPATASREIQVQNDLRKGAISANVYRGGKLLASKSVISPGQKAVFQFQQTLFVSVVSEVKEGHVMNSAVLSSVNTEFSLLGIASADIVMTGGGSRKDATEFKFHLENIVME